MMKAYFYGLIAASVFLVAAVMMPVAADQMIGGDQGWYVFYCHADGADVYLDDDYKGEITNGKLAVPVYTTATPYQTYKVVYESLGYHEQVSGTLTDYPAKGETVRIYVDIGPVPTPIPTQEPGPIGGDEGWYVFHCHANGAEVSLDGEDKGTIFDGELAVPVYTTATPYQTYTVTYETEGHYESETKTLPGVPAAGETIDIYVDITPKPVPTPTPEPKPIGGDQGWFDVYCNIDGADVYFDDDYKGTIENGVIYVPVYTTATPYTTVTVEKTGYTSTTEDINHYPGQGETLDIYVTLNH